MSPAGRGAPIAPHAAPVAPQAAPVAPQAAPPSTLVVFGASGDLTARKLLPALAQLAAHGLLPVGFAVVGVARSRLGDDRWRETVAEAAPTPSDAWTRIVAASRYVAGDYGDPDTHAQLALVLDELDRQRPAPANRVFYLATVPSVFADIVRALGSSGLAKPPADTASVRVVIEKPFGHDLASARQLDRDIHEVLREDQIYRIDHYLGKETVQNVIALRFANAIFEPIWNRRYVDHLQITVAEALGVEHRGSFYESAGALRDIVQNHVLQVLALTLMEPPATVNPIGIRDEKVKALRAVDILTVDEVPGDVVRGQYAAGPVDGQQVPGYREEEGVAPTSQTETFVAMKLRIDNWRWAGVPVYVRTGKRLSKRATEVVMQFKPVPHLPFAAPQARGLHPNVLLLRIQPDEGICLRFGAKVPGQTFEVSDVAMNFSYRSTFNADPPEAYERLLLDALSGDPTLFIRTDEVEQAWEICDPILQAWHEGDVPLARYAAGTWGPREAVRLLERDGRQWWNP
jgi:glucose-6-phosphate 1-dehydrogenase